jgi:TPR repeat protein
VPEGAYATKDELFKDGRRAALTPMQRNQLILKSRIARFPIEDANAAYARGDYATALRLFRRLADQGNTSAQAHLADMYANGKGVSRDYTEAVNWLRKGAEQGVADAQSALGAMYDLGKGVSQDYAEAVKWYRKAAEQGDNFGQFSLGAMYEGGQGVPQDYVHKWLILAIAVRVIIGGPFAAAALRLCGQVQPPL